MSLAQLPTRSSDNNGSEAHRHFMAHAVCALDKPPSGSVASSMSWQYPAVQAGFLMQNANDRILLSPSDLNEYIDCQHATTLALEVARGQRAVPHVANEEADLLRQ